ncbi:FtsL-like putative cell division protein [Hymenobacter weizhouensis]|uniref:FtsL-like putative cell division protein n=1 Tax=Hymenobacter sp. YIM 151500-1 TaxID=2987689 RepID=UPI002226FE6D|nr:FtsL-like putative cell division protein [Hymenobacter sp. YIM 151500-1]UYZ64824.1 FtsL-like putative cell division protein [Hymenobacter sp. YIM 151500-1]
MALNTVKPAANPPRANVPREAAPVAVEPVAAPQPEPAPQPAPKPPREPRQAPPKRSTWSVFSVLERATRVDGLFREGLPVRFLPYLLFIMFLTLVYIGNTHYATRMNRSIQKLKLETEDLRADYTTLKSDYMEASKQSEVARKVAAYGLVESSSPPFRITVPAGRLDEAELDRMPVLTADSVAAMIARAKADSLRRAAGPALSDSIEVGAPPVPIGTDVNGEPAVPETTQAASSNRSAPRRNERKR